MDPHAKKKEAARKKETPKSQGGESGRKEEKHPAAGESETVSVNRDDWERISAEAARAAGQKEDLLRLAADFANFRRRTENEKTRLARYAESLLISRLLPILDSIEHLADPEPDAGTGGDAGPSLVFRELRKTLTGMGLERLDVLDKPFDPSCAEAVEVVGDDCREEGTVVGVLRPGYRYHDILLRPAMVRISAKKDQAQRRGKDGADRGDSCPGEDKPLS